MVEKEVKEWAKTDSAKEQAEADQPIINPGGFGTLLLLTQRTFGTAPAPPMVITNQTRVGSLLMPPPKHQMLGKRPRFSAKRTQPRFEKPLSSMKKADKVKVVLELAQNHINDNAST